jgi:hypothetical protein
LHTSYLDMKMLGLFGWLPKVSMPKFVKKKKTKTRIKKCQLP